MMRESCVAFTACNKVMLVLGTLFDFVVFWGRTPAEFPLRSKGASFEVEGDSQGQGGVNPLEIQGI